MRKKCTNLLETECCVVNETKVAYSRHSCVGRGQAPGKWRVHVMMRVGSYSGNEKGNEG